MGVLASLALVLATPAPAGDVWKVPSGTPTIQAALNAAAPGDEIVVAPGVYHEHLNFHGKDVVLRSLAGPQVTILEGDGLDTVVLFEGGETNGAVLRGFTLTGGQGTGVPFSNLTRGGAVTCHLGSAPVIEGNVMRENEASWGGGVLAIRAAPVVRGNLFEKNSIVHFGGGVMLQDSDAVVEDNVFQDNLAGFPSGSGSAAGMYVAAISNPRIEGNVFRRNVARGSGGGLAINNSVFGSGVGHALVRRNCFEENVAGGQAGALWVTRSEPFLEGNVFRANRAREGAGLVILDSEVSMWGDVVVDNVATNSGGGLFARNDAVVHLVRASFVGNEAAVSGAALWGSSSTLELAGALFWQNDAAGGTPVLLEGTDLALQHSLLAGGASSVTSMSGSTLQLGAGMLDLDPQLDPQSLLPTLLAGSPCIDAGDPAEHRLARDASGAPALQDGDLDGLVRADVGALEFTHVRLEARLEGLELALDAKGMPGLPALLLVGTPGEPAPLGAYGLLLVGPPVTTFALGTLPVGLRLPVPQGFLESRQAFALQVLATLDGAHGNASNDVVLATGTRAARQP